MIKLLYLVLLFLPASQGYAPGQPFRIKAGRRRPQGFFLAASETPEEAIARRGERKGFYVRPSAAIERGGGFFIPGLEGWKLRAAISSTVLVLLAMNRLPGYDAPISQVVSEACSTLAAVTLLVQAVAQEGGLAGLDQSAPSDGEKPLFFSCSPSVDEQSFLWSSSAFLDLAKAHTTCVLSDGYVQACGGAYESTHSIAGAAKEGNLNAISTNVPEQLPTGLVSRDSQEATGLFQVLPSTATQLLVIPAGNALWIVGWCGVQPSDKQVKWSKTIGSYAALGL